MAGTVEAFSFLVWLRGGEIFSLNEGDIEYVPSIDGPKHGLRPGIGFLELRLNPTTKSDQEKQPDVIIADKSFAGIRVSLWFRLLIYARRCLGLHGGALFWYPGWFMMKEPIVPVYLSIPPPAPPTSGGGSSRRHWPRLLGRCRARCLNGSDGTGQQLQ